MMDDKGKHPLYEIAPSTPSPVSQDKIAEALRRMVYEATHLSPCKPNGDHDCTIKADALAQARAALALAQPAAGVGDQA